MILENDVLNFMSQRVYDQRAVRHTHNPVCLHDSSLHLSMSQLVTHTLNQPVSQSISQSVTSQSGVTKIIIKKNFLAHFSIQPKIEEI